MVRSACYAGRKNSGGIAVAVLNAKGSLVAGILAAIGASVCCVAPLVLLALGIGGAWIGNLTAFEPYPPLLHSAPTCRLPSASDWSSGRSPSFCSACWPCHGSHRCFTDRRFQCVDCSSSPFSPRHLASSRQTPKRSS